MQVLRRSPVYRMALLALVCLVAGCEQPSVRHVDKTVIEAVVPPALYFDLEERPTIAAAVVIPANAPKTELRLVVLPFASDTTEPSADVLSTWGTHAGVTALTYVAGPTTPASVVLPLKPRFDGGQEGDFTRTDLRGSLYFMSAGLKRRLVYSWPPPSIESEALRRLKQIPQTTIESVVVKLPADAEIFERGDRALAPVVEKFLQIGRVKIYPFLSASDKVALPLDITYQIPPTKLQNQIFEYGLKLFGALLVPIVSAFLLTSSKAKSPRLRATVLAVGIPVEILVLGGMLWWAFYIKSVAGLGAILDLSLALIAAVATTLLAFIKGE